MKKKTKQTLKQLEKLRKLVSKATEYAMSARFLETEEYYIDLDQLESIIKLDIEILENS